jgi:dienelactone hydrolase
MFEYFPDNYNWSLATSLSLGMGGEITEIDDACRPLRPLASQEDEQNLRAWYDRWLAIGNRAVELADDDISEGRARSGARKYRRAANYYLMAERMMTNESPLKMESYERALRAFRASVTEAGEPVEFVDVPFGDASLPALFVPAEGATGPAPCVIVFNGYDVTKEILYMMGVAELARRGISVLVADQPGSGGALRLHGLTARHDTEVPASACVDYLESRPDVDPERIGLVGISMGGYYAPRAAAFEKRIKACVAWGAFHDLGGVVQNLLETNAHSAPSFQAAWVFGMDDSDDPAERAQIIPRFSLDGVAEQIEAALLVLHGEDDRQVPVEQARRTYEQATSARTRELKIYPKGSWGDQHCQCDDPSLAVDYLSDWLAGQLAPVPAVPERASASA